MLNRFQRRIIFNYPGLPDAIGFYEGVRFLPARGRPFLFYHESTNPRIHADCADSKPSINTFLLEMNR